MRRRCETGELIRSDDEHARSSCSFVIIIALANVSTSLWKRAARIITKSSYCDKPQCHFEYFPQFAGEREAHLVPSDVTLSTDFSTVKTAVAARLLFCQSSASGAEQRTRWIILAFARVYVECGKTIDPNRGTLTTSTQNVESIFNNHKCGNK